MISGTIAKLARRLEEAESANSFGQLPSTSAVRCGDLPSSFACGAITACLC